MAAVGGGGRERGQSPPPITLAADLLADYRAEHPLAEIFPLLYDVAGHAAGLRQRTGRRGRARAAALGAWKPAMLRRAESIGSVEGAQWDERHAGTNAPGTALCLDAPVTIKSAEHFVRPVQRWSCAAAPVHEPGSEAILGVIDITGGRGVGSPQTIAMVRAAARMAESELARRALVAAVRYPEPGRAGSAGRRQPVTEISLSALGRSESVVSIGPRTLRLSPRHSEIMIILAGCPTGLTGDELAYLLYPDDLISSTLRAELVRLRALLGGQVLASRPYRLTCEVTSDWAAVSAQLAASDLAEALRLYRGPLLPRSEAPGVVELRGDLDRALRAAILASGQPEFLVGWTRSRWGADDLEMWQRLCAVLPRPRRCGPSPRRPPRSSTPTSPAETAATYLQHRVSYGGPVNPLSEGHPPWDFTQHPVSRAASSVQDRYGKYIGGSRPAEQGEFFENISPVTGQPFTEIARSTAEDIDLALDAAHGAKRSGA